MSGPGVKRAGMAGRRGRRVAGSLPLWRLIGGLLLAGAAAGAGAGPGAAAPAPGAARPESGGPARLAPAVKHYDFHVDVSLRAPDCYGAAARAIWGPRPARRRRCQAPGALPSPSPALVSGWGWKERQAGA